MWSIEPSDDYLRRHKRFEKKRPRELEAVLVNLKFVIEALNEGANPQRLPFGFLHIEPHGVIAIDQRGGGKSLAETRLYVFLDRQTSTVHLLTLGDKKTQSADLKTAIEYRERLSHD